MPDNYNDLKSKYSQFEQLYNSVNGGGPVANSKRQMYGSYMNMLREQMDAIDKTSVDESKGKMQDRYDELTDPNSKYYKEYGDYLKKYMPHASQDSLLGRVVSTGMGYNNAKAISDKQFQQSEINRGETIQKGISDFYMGNQQMAEGILGNIFQADNSNYQFNEQMRMRQAQNQYEKNLYENSQPTFGDELLNIGGGLLGQFLGGGGLSNLFGSGKAGAASGYKTSTGGGSGSYSPTQYKYSPFVNPFGEKGRN